MMLKTEIRRIGTDAGEMKLIILRPLHADGPVPGILWIHGGGYRKGYASMVYITLGRMLAKRYGGVVLSPEYRLSTKAPYPAALEDSYAALEYLWAHAEELGIDREKIVVGGESAGGGLTAAVCLRARDEGKIPVAMQIPLYPMIDSEDTETSRDNHGKVWDTKKNHEAWKLYLGDLYGTDQVPPYASPSRAKDLHGLPPCYSFVCDGEPFYQETLDYVKRLQEAGVRASCDIYRGNVHAFDLLRPWRKESREAKKKLREVYQEIIVKN